MKPKIIICVKSCQRDLERGDHHVIRNTWGKAAADQGILVRFFIGKHDKIPKLQPDEVMLDCGDEYIDLPFKTREICRWLTGKIVDFGFLCDTDTYIYIPEMMTCHFEQNDYLGHTLHAPNKVFKQSYETTDFEGHKTIISPCYTWCSGGLGYFLSYKAIREVADNFPMCWAEDMFVGQVLGPGTMVGEFRIQSTRTNDYTGNIFSWHFDTADAGQKDGAAIHAWMKEEHSKH